MAFNLVIMESPSKANTVKGYLGSNYKVIASVGHIRDLPKSTLGVDIDNDFDAHYINIRGKGDVIKEIKDNAKKAGKIYLATDPDREGEAIAWHLSEVLGIPLSETKRVSFNEVTKTAVKNAIKEPRNIDMNLVNSQQARRILDRIVGYKLSPLLWKNIRSGLSAGRVQSVATRMIVERENEIKNFVPEEYWTVTAELRTADGNKVIVTYYGNETGKVRLTNGEEAKKITALLQRGDITVKSVKKAEKKKMPQAPFTTSTLQQEAFRKLNFQSSKTMKVAQELYEGVNLGASLGGVQGLITYMRTDSVRVSEEAQQKAKDYIVGKYGTAYAPEKFRQYKVKGSAQDAHEAVRPTRIDLEPSQIKGIVSGDQYKLYKLIWECFIASQMERATLDTTSVEVESNGNLFRTAGYTVRFPGYMALYEGTEESSDDATGDGEKDLKLPELKEKEKLSLVKAQENQHFTEPPVRYNDASLIKAFKDMDIGRPSTYATIISTILAREYVKRDGRTLVPTDLGILINDLMMQHFAGIMDYGFTADMEKKLDKIAGGNTEMKPVLRSFWKEFSEQLEEAEKNIDEVELPPEQTNLVCEKCGATMILKSGRFGKFAACPNYPACKNTKPLNATEIKPELTEEKCEKCGAPLMLRNGRFGVFYSCSKYPECDFTKAKTEDTGVACPECGKGTILTRYGRNRKPFYGCSRYPECTYSTWDEPSQKKCPDCGGILFYKKNKTRLACHNKACGYTEDLASDGDNQ